MKKNAQNLAETLYQSSKQAKSTFFCVPSGRIKIITDPLDFYMSIVKGINGAYQRVGLSALYLGTGTLQRYLLNCLQKRMNKIPQMKSVLLFDYNRSVREQKGSTSTNILKNYHTQIKNGDNALIGFYQNAKKYGVGGQILGVHHQKIFIFDDDIVIGGANLSHNYFLNRKDRYIKISSCPQLADYLYDYISTLAENSLQITKQSERPTYPKQKKRNMLHHYKLWKYSYMPVKYQENLAQQEKYLEEICSQRQAEHKRGQDLDKQTQVKSRNLQLAEQLGTSIEPKKFISPQQYQARKNQVRQNLFSAHQQQYLGNYLTSIDVQTQENQSLAIQGQKVYIFPFITNTKLGENQYKTFQQVINQAILQNIPIKIASGYMNIPSDVINQMSHSQTPVQILCSSPQANSFYRAGFIKKYIPFFYRFFQQRILRKFPSKFLIKQFIQASWSFHTKGLWLKQHQNSYLTIVGSSNYNQRSRSRDTQFQFYLYSTCPQFNSRLDKEWENLNKHCKIMTLQEIEKDEEIKINWWIRIWAKLVSSFL